MKREYSERNFQITPQEQLPIAPLDPFEKRKEKVSFELISSQAGPKGDA